MEVNNMSFKFKWGAFDIGFIYFFTKQATLMRN